MTPIYFQIQVLIITVLSAQSALGLKCYVCNSANDAQCSMSPPPAKYLQECSQDTLEMLNDMHRQTKLEGAGLQPSPTNGANAGTLAPGAAGSPGGEDAAPGASPAPPTHPMDKEDKDLTFNRTARGAEDIPTNSTPSKPVNFSTSPINLPKEATFCRKTSYHIPAQSNGPNSTLKASIRVIRSCGWIPEPKKEGEQSAQSSCKWIGTEGVQMDQCVCNGDGCNSGNYLGSLTSQTLVLLAVMTAGYFYVL